MMFPKLNRAWADWRGPEIPIFPREATIPRILHQTSFAPPWPREVEDGVSRLKTLHPDWTYRFYTNDDCRTFIAQHYGPDILEYDERLHPSYGAAKADLFRYLLMYKVGGVYLDIKSKVTRSLTETIDPAAGYILARWPGRETDEFAGWAQHAELMAAGMEELQQWHIICEPGHPFLQAVILAVLRNIDAYSPSRDKTGKHAVLQVTGPIAYTLAIKPLLATERHQMRDMSDLGVGYSVFAGGGSSHEQAFTSHYAKLREPLVMRGRLRTLTFKSLRQLKFAVRPR